MNTHKLTFAAVAALAVALTLAIAPALTTQAFAKIQAVDTGCETRGGGTPQGQQPTCQGEGLEQQRENRNPAGKAPPGQN